MKYLQYCIFHGRKCVSKLFGGKISFLVMNFFNQLMFVTLIGYHKLENSNLMSTESKHLNVSAPDNRKTPVAATEMPIHSSFLYRSTAIRQAAKSLPKSTALLASKIIAILF